MTSAGAAPSGEPPILTGQVTDLAGALPTDHPDVDKALADLKSAREVDLYVVFVATNDGGSARDFARSAWNANDLGGRDILMVVATDEQTVQFWQEGEVADSDAAARQLFASRGLQLPASLQEFERVGHLLDAVINARPGTPLPPVPVPVPEAQSSMSCHG